MYGILYVRHLFLKENTLVLSIHCITGLPNGHAHKVLRPEDAQRRSDHSLLQIRILPMVGVLVSCILPLKGRIFHRWRKGPSTCD